MNTPFKRTLRESGFDQDEGISAHSRQTAQLIGWSLRSRRNEMYLMKCSAPPPTLELTGECYGIQPYVLNGTA